jgi:transposase
VPDEPVPDDAAGLRAANARLREVLGAKDAEIGTLQAGLDAVRERERRLELRLAELERRLGMDSSDSGTPSSKERIGAKEARRARRQESERDRRQDRKPGGQPGHPGKGLARDPEPGARKEAPPPAECRGCRAGLDGAAAVAKQWAQVIDAEIVRTVTEWALPGLECPCCGTVTRCRQRCRSSLCAAHRWVSSYPLAAAKAARIPRDLGSSGGSTAKSTSTTG